MGACGFRPLLSKCAAGKKPSYEGFRRDPEIFAGTPNDNGHIRPARRPQESARRVLAPLAQRGFFRSYPYISDCPGLAMICVEAD
ncbi:hypothetical protein QFZ89_002767 [Paraburkholderia youngii]